MNSTDALREIAKLQKYSPIEAELQRAKTIHPDWPDDLYVQLTVMQEEAGEVAKAILDFSFHKGPAGDIKKELIQTAAMCMRMLENFGTNELYTKIMLLSEEEMQEQAELKYEPGPLRATWIGGVKWCLSALISEHYVDKDIHDREAVRQRDELREALVDMVWQFAYTCSEGYHTGGLSALEGAFGALGLSDPITILDFEAAIKSTEPKKPIEDCGYWETYGYCIPGCGTDSCKRHPLNR